MVTEFWTTIKSEANEQLMQEPELGGFFSRRILQHEDLASAVSDLLAEKLANSDMPAANLKSVFNEALRGDPEIIEAVKQDLVAVRERDPAVTCYATALLYFKGFQA